LLLHHYLFESNRKRKKPLRGVSEAAMSALTAYSWPGNVGELAELVRSISTRKRQGSVVDAADLPTEILYGRRRKAATDDAPAAKPPPDIREAIKDLDHQMVRQALALSEGDREKAASLLNIEVDVLEKLMREGGVEEETRGDGR
jgi:DNA-binding NtrC family response regulator